MTIPSIFRETLYFHAFPLCMLRSGAKTSIFLRTTRLDISWLMRSGCLWSMKKLFIKGISLGIPEALAPSRLINFSCTLNALSMCKEGFCFFRQNFSLHTVGGALNATAGVDSDAFEIFQEVYKALWYITLFLPPCTLYHLELWHICSLWRMEWLGYLRFGERQAFAVLCSPLQFGGWGAWSDLLVQDRMVQNDNSNAINAPISDPSFVGPAYSRSYGL